MLHSSPTLLTSLEPPVTGVDVTDRAELSSRCDTNCCAFVFVRLQKITSREKKGHKQALARSKTSKTLSSQRLVARDFQRLRQALRWRWGLSAHKLILPEFRRTASMIRTMCTSRPSDAQIGDNDSTYQVSVT